MSRKHLSMIIAVVILTLGFAMVSSANVPPPPVNQNAGIDDSIFNNLDAEQCRFCHDLGNGPVDGVCSVSGNACTVGDTSTCADPQNETCLAILAKNRHHLLVDGLIVEGSLLFRDPIDPPKWTIDANNDGVDDTNYACENCHPDDPGTPIIEFPVTRDCLVCHEQQPGVGSVHHIAETSPAQQGVCNVCHGDIVDTQPGYCTGGGGMCAVDADCPAGETCGDGHVIPTYDPSLVTPKPSKGKGPAGDSSNPNLADFPATNRGACDYCHSTGNRHGRCESDPNEECSLVFDPLGGDCATPGDECLPDPNGSHDPENPGSDDASGVIVYGNSVTHHNTGVGNFDTMENCEWCHPDPADPGLGSCSLTGVACTEDSHCPGENNFCNTAQEIRTCENCHGFESLHNIALDSDGDGFLNVGAEDPWWSHVGNSQDCEGCHRGYGSAEDPGIGPITPIIVDVDVRNVLAGTDTVINLYGEAFTNTTEGTSYTSDAVMTAADGSSVTLTPSALTQSSMTVTIPGSTAVGSYALRAVKAAGSESNKVVINVIPDVVIDKIACKGKNLTVNGSGFSETVPQASDYINVDLNGVTITDITSWSDTRIRAKVSSCPSTSVVSVNALFGKDTEIRTTGKIKKPKK